VLIQLAKKIIIWPICREKYALFGNHQKKCTGIRNLCDRQS